ncbi:hypothetical protein BDM02DRAFT_3114851 [Thelephora ganbajun]|uniref:Uncharacterized protein n=1 Tax=Thelephora ganbajun TaxID=370292 RepID=A0ACB6ZG91_THEGA|nr:hypothetical protein BDM02DRAFT_3114851 [Thelephora ganbajun]
MRVFPQELVDLVVDKLAEFPGPFGPFTPHVEISDYSTISRQWLTRTQKHHFEMIQFNGQDDLEKWRTTIEPDPSGVSRHVRRLFWLDLDTLEGFDEHIRAFTHVKRAEFSECELFNLLDDVLPLTLLGSSLVELEIDMATTTPGVMASLLAALPHLGRLLARNLKVEHDYSYYPIPLPARIPFFEGANTLSLTLRKYLPGYLDWIPQIARFRDLRVDCSLAQYDWVVVNRWITSSSESLEYLGFEWDTWGFPFDPLDLSGCTSLRTVKLPVPLSHPGIFGEIVLPSLSSPQLSRVVLELRETDTRGIDSDGWKKMDKYLSRLAKRFKATHEGTKMEVEVFADQEESALVLEQIRDWRPMPDTEKEAIVVFRAQEN